MTSLIKQTVTFEPVTVTLHVDSHDVTVELHIDDEGEWHVANAVNEEGDHYYLSDELKAEAIKLAEAGVDETGR
jgi:hypothetical protein